MRCFDLAEFPQVPLAISALLAELKEYRISSSIIELDLLRSKLHKLKLALGLRDGEFEDRF